MHKIDLFCSFIRLVTFGSICQIFMGHVLHIRCDTTSSDHQRWASQFPCPQRSFQPLGTQDKYTNDWVTAPGVVRPASRGAEGGEWVGMCVQVRAVVTWGDRELRPHGTDTQQEGCVWQQLFRDRNRTFGKSCRPCSSVSSGCQRLPFSLGGLLWRSHMLLPVIELEIYKRVVTCSSLFNCQQNQDWNPGYLI